MALTRLARRSPPTHQPATHQPTTFKSKNVSKIYPSTSLILNSRGSVIPFFLEQRKNGVLPITSNDIIISDQRMPQMSGTEFLSLTAQRYPDIIRIILTGYTDVEDLVEAINSGKVFKYVTKPWDDEQLKQVVRQATDTHNVLRTRTEELRRNLRRETLLNAVTGTLRSTLSYEELLRAIAGVVGQTLEVSRCILRPDRKSVV